MDFEKLASIHLIQGAGGGDPKAGLCIMEMVSYFDGAERVTDHPECACPALTKYAIRLNDTAPSQEDRDSLKPLLPLLAGTRDAASIDARVRYLVFETARRIVAPLFDKHWPNRAKAIREALTYEEMKTAAYAGAAAADAYAYAAAYVDAYAADAAAAYAAAAYAGAAAAYAYAYAAAYVDAYAADAAAAYAAAADAAYAAAYAAYAAAADAADAKRQVWFTAKDILTEAIKLGPHGGLDMDAPETEARAEQLLELIGS
jgi:hypothetical protein